MAEFDDVLAEAQKQVEAINAVLAENSNIVKKIQEKHAALPDPRVVEEQAQDDARANALRRLLEQSPINTPAPDVA